METAKTNSKENKMQGTIECYDSTGTMFDKLDVLEYERNNTIMEIGPERLRERPEYMIFVNEEGRRFGCMTADEFYNGRPYVHEGANSNTYVDWEDFEERISDYLYRGEYEEDVEDTLAVFKDDLEPWEDGIV
jgi:hypothetical protein